MNDVNNIIGVNDEEHEVTYKSSLYHTSHLRRNNDSQKSQCHSSGKLVCILSKK